MNFPAKQRGMTLMELLQVIGIVAVVFSFGVPSMTSLMRSNQSVAYVNEVVSTMHAARTQAVQNSVQVTICKSANQQSCGNDEGVWREGWIAFEDRNANGVRELGEDPEVIVYAHAELDDTYTLSSTAFTDWMAFLPNGRAIGSHGNAGNFVLCVEDRPESAKSVNISRTGSPAIDESAPGVCK